MTLNDNDICNLVIIYSREGRSPLASLVCSRKNNQSEFFGLANIAGLSSQPWVDSPIRFYVSDTGVYDNLHDAEHI